MSFATSELRRAALAVLLTLTSCGTTMQVPEPFLRLDSPGSQLKATTPDDARIWVREFDDPDAGTAEFWSEALGHDLLARGYRPCEVAAGFPDGEVRDGTGAIGRAATYTVDVEGQPHGYLVVVFAVAGWFGHSVRVVEFVAPEARFAELLPAVWRSIATLEG